VRRIGRTLSARPTIRRHGLLFVRRFASPLTKCADLRDRAARAAFRSAFAHAAPSLAAVARVIEKRPLAIGAGFQVAAALMAQAGELFSSPPSIEKVDVLAAKLPG
jgi:hypothetical protein